MTTRYIMNDRVSRVEERIARRHVRGFGEHAEFAPDSEGWYVTLESGCASIYLGRDQPGLKAGDTVRLTVERA